MRRVTGNTFLWVRQRGDNPVVCWCLLTGAQKCSHRASQTASCQKEGLSFTYRCCQRLIQCYVSVVGAQGPWHWGQSRNLQRETRRMCLESPCALTWSKVAPVSNCSGSGRFEKTHSKSFKGLHDNRGEGQLVCNYCSVITKACLSFPWFWTGTLAHYSCTMRLGPEQHSGQRHILTPVCQEDL